MRRTVQTGACILFLIAPLCASFAIAESEKKEISIRWQEIVQPPSFSDNETQIIRFESYRDALANGSFDEAEIAAKEMVEFSASNTNSEPRERARVLHNLAVAQHLSGNFDAAILNYQTAIDEAASNEDMLSSTLILPLRGLGSAFADAGLPVESFRSFDRALHISNVNHGPHNLTQLPILGSIIHVHMEQDDASTAVKVLERISQLYERTYHRDSTELLPLFYQQATLYKSLGMSAEERESWGRVLEILRHHNGKDDLTLVEPYLELGRNLVGELDKMIFRSGPTAPTAERFLKRALLISEENPDADWQIRRKCLLALADYYSLVEMHARANRYYQQTWKLLSSDDAYLPQRATDLEITVPLSQPHPHPFANFEYNPESEKINPNDYLQGEIIVQFTVTKKGRTKDIRVVESDPPDFTRMERRVRNALKEFKYRPRYADGIAIQAEKQRYSSAYSYLPGEYAASRAKSGKLGSARVQ